MCKLSMRYLQYDMISSQRHNSTKTNYRTVLCCFDTSCAAKKTQGRSSAYLIEFNFTSTYCWFKLASVIQFRDAIKPFKYFLCSTQRGHETTKHACHHVQRVSQARLVLQHGPHATSANASYSNIKKQGNINQNARWQLAIRVSRSG